MAVVWAARSMFLDDISAPWAAAQFLLVGSIPMLALQRPWRGKPPSQTQVMGVMGNAAMLLCISVLWIAALALLGPVRLLLLERAEVLASVALDSTGGAKSKARSRSALCIIGAVLFSLWPHAAAPVADV